ncbi:MFS transporter [Paenibacillus ginsengarvi]|uniref:MFS transporter n=1 Tax=Paenibacillus ginsengarvi TaxID=400777 RepID=A0A3B0CIQ1_9BACL|nr:MFS transporter [Paenibacillus ginsengarvi]RKN84880.1 MFS transporter [Paenibacillus ginsengarvi]
MNNWKLNLIVLWFGNFLVMAGMTMIIPFLPLYIQQLGITDPGKVAFWSGIVFAGNFVTSFIFQPIWGKLADRHGRKVMLLRSGFGMALVMVLMGFAGNVWHLFLLRMLNGTISGFVPAAVALMSTTTPREKIGFSMGTLQSGGTAGSILGPFIGGLLAEWVGFRPIFYITGTLLFFASMLAMIVVKEKFDASKAAKLPNVSVVAGLKELGKIPQLTSLFTVTFLIQFSMLSSMPLIPLFVQHLHGEGQMLAFFAGLVGSITGFSNMIASPLLGRLGDRIGQEKVLGLSLIGAAVMFIPQALVQNVWQLFAARFMLGMFMGGLLPSVNALIRKYTPDGMESRSYSFNSSFLALGNMIGPVVGGALSGLITIRGIFLIATVMLIANAVWVRKTLIRRSPVAGQGS